jgi:hypothetical protein
MAVSAASVGSTSESALPRTGEPYTSRTNTFEWRESAVKRVPLTRGNTPDYLIRDQMVPGP